MPGMRPGAALCALALGARGGYSIDGLAGCSGRSSLVFGPWPGDIARPHRGADGDLHPCHRGPPAASVASIALAGGGRRYRIRR
ncbi:MAG: hypothetical protein ACLQI7_05330 [Streptosporangiaceae bacterium]